MVPFALTPGQVDPTNALDYTTSSGIKIWHEATAPLTFKFNVKGKEVNTFCEALAQRAQQSGWTLTRANVIMIDDSSTPEVAQNIITEYSLLTVNDITTYVTPWTGNNTRQAQNNFQMYTCIMASLTKDGCTKILAEQNKYHIRQHPCTTILFKLLMQKAVINTHETSSLL